MNDDVHPDTRIKAEPVQRESIFAVAVRIWGQGVPIFQHLPLQFPNGAINALSFRCEHCGLELEQTEVMGNVRMPVRSTYLIEALGYCHPCRAFTPFRFRAMPGRFGFQLKPADRERIFLGKGADVVPYPQFRERNQDAYSRRNPCLCSEGT